MRKGQVEGQIAVFILAGVVVIMILLYGYKAIQDFSNKADTISYIQFRKELDQNVQSIASDLDSVIEEEFRLPKADDEVCFMRSGATSAPTSTIHYYKSSVPAVGNHDIITQNWQDGSNVFLFDRDELADAPFTVDNIITDPTDSRVVLCYHADGNRVKIRMIGRGNGAQFVKPNDWLVA